MTDVDKNFTYINEESLEIVKFKCAPNCGLCCKASPVTVLPHEVYILTSIAEELGVRARFAPAYKIAEKRSGLRIALSYLMQLDPEGKCPFLNGAKCSIHDVYKPLTCRSFPYLPKVLRYHIDWATREIRIEVNFVMSTLCPVVKRDLSPIDILRMSNVKVAYNYAPQEVESALETYRKRTTYVEILSDLWKKGVIELDEEYKYPFAPIVNAYSFIRRFYPELAIDKL